MSIVGAILGDIAGSQYEFDRTTNPLVCPLFNGDSMYTDDTVMTLAIKKAIDNQSDLTATMREVGGRYPLCGYGGHFFDWIYCTNPKPYNSLGNGAAMRVSYIADYFDKLDDIKKYAEKTAEVSHNHPEGIKGAITTAVCIWMAKNNKSKDDIINYVLKQYPTESYAWSVDKDLEYLKAHYSWDVTCMTSVPVAIRCFYESDSYEGFIRNVLSLDCDADTICAIGGSIAEEFYGGTGFDDYKILETYLDDYLLKIYKGEYENG